MWHDYHDGRSVRQSGNGCPEVRLMCVPEFHDEWVVFERLLNDPPLHALAASVNQPHLAQAGFVCSGDVLDDD